MARWRARFTDGARTQRVPLPCRGEHHLVRVDGRCQTEDAEPARQGLLCQRLAHAGKEIGDRPHLRQRPHGAFGARRPEEARPPARPAPGGPARELDDVGSGSPSRDLRDRPQIHTLRRLHPVGHHPPATTPPVQLDPHRGAHVHVVPELLGDHVVEGLVYGRLVGQDPDDPQRAGQSPRADFSSAALSVRSQVNSSSSRPKCP